MQHRKIVDVTEGPNPKARQRSLGYSGESEVHPAGRSCREQHGEHCKPDHLRNEIHVDRSAAESVVDYLLHRNGDNDATGCGGEGNGDGPRQATA
jgi:hypothetical protein